MNSHLLLRKTSLCALLLIGGGLAATAHGQQIETLTVEAAREAAGGSSVESCTQDAVKSAMVEADAVIAARRAAK